MAPLPGFDILYDELLHKNNYDPIKTDRQYRFLIFWQYLTITIFIALLVLVSLNIWQFVIR